MYSSKKLEARSSTLCTRTKGTVMGTLQLKKQTLNRAPPLKKMKGTIMLLTPKQVREAKISTATFAAGYDMEETDSLLDECEHTISILGGVLLEMKKLLEAHNIQIPSTIRGIA